MDKTRKQNYVEQIFGTIEDWRIERRKLHRLKDILFMSVCAITCGAEGFTDIEEFGKSKTDWLREYIDLKEGIPSHDTIGRIFMGMSPKLFGECFTSFMSSIAKLTDGEIIAIDGKQLRGMKDSGNGQYALYMVSAWAVKNRMCLAQEKVDNKSNEITTLPKILEKLDLAGTVVTIDAMGTQKKTAEQIIASKGDYILALKGNQGNLHKEVKEVKEVFAAITSGQFKNIVYDSDEWIDAGHGRIEIRKCYATTQFNLWGKSEETSKWAGLTSAVMIESRRIIGDKEEQEKRYYISSLLPDAHSLNRCIRSHWGVENSLHWVLDVVFREDASRIRTDHAPENFALLRRMALGLVNRNKGSTSIRRARFKAALNDKFLNKLIFGHF